MQLSVLHHHSGELILGGQGERDYKELRGPTGPLVYPAGFLYIYSIFYKISKGEVFPAQIIFTLLYLLNLALVLRIYIQAKVSRAHWISLD